MANMGSKEAAAYILDPMTAPEPFAETGPGAHFQSTFAPAASSSTKPKAATTTVTESSPRTSLNSNNPFRDGATRQSPPLKGEASSSVKPVGGGSPSQRFPDFESPKRRSGSAHPPPPSYDQAAGSTSKHRRRTSSLKERYPGDKSAEPLNTIRRDSNKADRSSHLKKRHQPGPDTIDKLDPAIGGVPYHHEGPYDATLLARNTSYKSSPIAALKTSNEETLKATPQENIKDAVERHQPLDGTAVIAPGVPDRLGRVYNYEEGADLKQENQPDGPAYKRWADKDPSRDDPNGESEPMYSLDRKLRAHNINDDGIELQSGTNVKNTRGPVELAGGESKHADVEIAQAHDNDASPRRSGSFRDGLKKRIGSLRHKKHDD